jgi:type VI secretion system protein ImpM
MSDSTGLYVTGCYGKLPARGDFISRSLSPAFVEHWDAWLQSAMQASRERLGAEWLDCYLSAPIWRFLLAPGLAGREAMAGVLLPSVDRVGRHFPLTIAATIAAESLDLPRTLVEADSWFAELEETALAALDPALDMDAFEARIASLAFPAASLVRPQDEGDTVPPRRPEPVFAHLDLGRGLSAPELLAQLSSRLYGLLEPFALWMTRASEVSADCVLASEGLPPGEQFCAMLDGDWPRHGWEEREPVALQDPGGAGG